MRVDGFGYWYYSYKRFSPYRGEVRNSLRSIILETKMALDRSKGFHGLPCRLTAR